MSDRVSVWKETPAVWSFIALSVLLMLVTFLDGLSYMVEMWVAKEEYSYGFLIPFISLFLIWQRKNELEKIPFTGSWLGVAVATIGLLLLMLGELSTLYTIVQYAFLIVLMGTVLALVGRVGFKILFIPLFILFFMIPLPDFILKSLTADMQLISSEIGVWVIQLFGISVFLDGNVIDLGPMKLQVVEACSGLNYLFPLMTFGFISAYFYREVFWKRALIFLSTIPITILMNSFRIGLIGILVEYWGQSMAEGLLHDFQGWAVFEICVVVLTLEMWLLSRIGENIKPFSQIFAIDFPESSPQFSDVHYRALPKSFFVSSVMLLFVALMVVAMPERTELVPKRDNFNLFPLSIDEWSGRDTAIEQQYLDVLKLSDYWMADYRKKSDKINLYIAYYDSQKKGRSAHSPKSCIPGGGWQITDLETSAIDRSVINFDDLNVNRAVIQKGDFKQIVYYWFQQRNRNITNEYLVKWYLFWDALTKNRTDGSMIRLITSVQSYEDEAIADGRLAQFIQEISPILPKYIPE